MTSTRFNVGLADSRNSSRVLRPPGGGNSDILGLGPEPPQQVRKGNPRNISSILEGTDQGMKEEVKEVKSPMSPCKEPPKQVEEQKRGRVPPGGFSSGLW